MAPLASEALNTTFLAEEEIAPLLHASAQVLLPAALAATLTGGTKLATAIGSALLALVVCLAHVGDQCRWGRHHHDRRCDSNLGCRTAQSPRGATSALWQVWSLEGGHVEVQEGVLGLGPDHEHALHLVVNTEDCHAGKNRTT